MKKIERGRYRFHLMDKNGIIFRYDNALHHNIEVRFIDYLIIPSFPQDGHFTFVGPEGFF
jgi:hypothetical protein